MLAGCFPASGHVGPINRRLPAIRNPDADRRERGMDDSRFDALVARLAGSANRREIVVAALVAMTAAPVDRAGAAGRQRCIGLQQSCSSAKGCCQPTRGKVACRLLLGALTKDRTCCGLAKVSCTTSGACCPTFGCNRDTHRCVHCRPGGASCVTGGLIDGVLCCSLVETGGICGPSCRRTTDCASGQQCCSLQASYPGYPFGFCSETCEV